MIRGAAPPRRNAGSLHARRAELVETLLPALRHHRDSFGPCPASDRRRTAASLPPLFVLQPMEIYVDDEAKLTLHGLVQHYVVRALG